ncbi:hypothetical protein DBB42_04700 [Pseudomonas plecoglossicida]|uniref:Metallo-beta-lactamase domain-containing protein n=1 Tax=Pseudomonas plecoglossicida TaxID=70775 RepID=A0A2R7UQ30_PSEDL|nr:MBL fold metallo-hydrolase [Pseudomonas plecoglossicida]PTU53385.1 hypothetical protein DBB42_04700 [Pseudomonas plecoglossicida]
MSHVLNVVDVGHGNCAVIQSEGKCVVVDAASKVHLLKYLVKNNITVIDLMILSHSDQDHIAGLQPVLASPEITVKRLVVSADSQKHTDVWEDVRALIAERVEKNLLDLVLGVHSKSSNEWGVINDRLSLEVISPSSAMALAGSGMAVANGTQKLTSNSISIVLRVNFDGQPIVLLAGDMDRIALDELLAKSPFAPVKFLVYPHHGGLPGNACPVKFTNDIISFFSPECIIFSNGRNMHSNPRPQVVAALRKANAHLYIACTQLSNSCCAEVVLERAYIPSNYSAGSSGGAYCSGTVEIDLERAEILSELKQAHEQFVRGLDSRMCC